MLRNAEVTNADVGVSDVTDSGSVLAIAHQDQATQAVRQLYSLLFPKLTLQSIEL